MISRTLEQGLLGEASKYPAIAILGPRQSGKTTLAKAVFKNHTYISFEDSLGAQEFAKTDPKGFLESYRNEHGIILDEFQHVPHILSYVQLEVDREYKPGYFVLTGSQNFLLNQAITQTLAGRIAITTLLPLSIEELQHASLLPQSPEALMLRGAYPRLYDQNIAPDSWYPNYIKTYLERDVRQLKNVVDLSLFQMFVRLCAGRIGQLLNVSSLANDCGITIATADSWLSVLEASYILFLVKPYHNNFSKRMIKSPKLYFYDTGLACSLLGVSSVDQVYSHYLRGGLFESMVISNILKHYYNHDKTPQIYFWQGKSGLEVDCLIEQGTTLIPIEIKAGKTIVADYFDNLAHFNEIAGTDEARNVVVYAGDENQKRSKGRIIGWQSMSTLFES